MNLDEQSLREVEGEELERTVGNTGRRDRGGIGGNSHPHSLQSLYYSWQG